MTKRPLVAFWAEFSAFTGTVPRYAIAVFMAVAMAVALCGQYLLRGLWPAAPFLLGATLLAVVPLCVDLFSEVAKGNFSVDLLAFLSIASALVLGEFWVSAIVVLMLSGGKALEEYATRRASSVLSALARRMPQIAHVLQLDGSIADLASESIAIGQQVVLYPHELCPVDGIVLSGLGAMDESYLTGEPFLIEKAPGATVLSGAINGEASLTIRATHVAADSRYARIVEVLRASEAHRPSIRRLGDRLGSWYTPIAVVLALGTWLVTGQPERFLAVLVIATPCPLLLAIPVAIIGAVSVGARRGIIIKDPSILEKLGTCQVLIVDKTGTLTYGRPQLTDVVPGGDWDRRALLQFAASLERYSKHPLATALLRAAADEGIALSVPDRVSESPGRGLSGQISGHAVVLTGRGRLPAELADQLQDVAPGLECVVLVDDQFAGLMRFQDEPRAESMSFLRHVESHHGIRETVLLSGDRPVEVANFAAAMGISRVHGGMSPEQKVQIVREITARVPSLYLGDGINDAPAMMNATAGIALGVNSDITSEAAGAVILQSSLGSVDELVHIGARMRRIALTSAVGGMGLSLLGMAAAAAGYLKPVEGALLQEVIDLFAIFNSLRMILPTQPLSDFQPPENLLQPVLTPPAETLLPPV
ncbi:MAG TPA: heavy metal translocating P-type ATPase [Terracidiphilus sp.]|nr:heavy metal translocating P-type ATPase [Terracidiphilus sp.]